MLKSKKLAVYAISVFSFLFIVGCGSPIQESTPENGADVVKLETVYIGSFSRAIDYAPFIIAKNTGLFDEVAEKYGVDIEYQEFQSLPAINEAIGTANLDIVFEAEPPAIIGKAAGIDIKIVSPGVSLTQEILVPTESDINEVADLKGKKIAVPSGSSSHYGLNKILSQAGLTKDDVEIIDMSPPDGKAAFVSRQIDGWAIWPPFVEQEQYNETGRVLTGSNVFIQSIVAMRGKFGVENPDLARDLVAAIWEAQDWILANTDEAQQIVADELGIELEVVKLAWEKHNFKPSIGPEEIADIQDKADFLFEMSLVKNQVDVEQDLIDLY